MTYTITAIEKWNTQCELEEQGTWRMHSHSRLQDNYQNEHYM